MWRAIALLVAAVVGAGVVAGTQALALAHDHRVPKTVLMEGHQELQAGIKVYEFKWIYPSTGTICAFQYATLVTRFRAADTVVAGSKLRVRILKTQRPRSFDILAYKRVNENEIPIGKGRALPVTLRRVLQEGETVAWDAVFRVDRPNRDYYLISEGHWKDVEGCGGDQYAYWSFHVQTGHP
jgi:hypothetical protein